MKTAQYILLALLLAQIAFGQGKLEFVATLTPIPSAPSGTPGATAIFELYEGNFLIGLVSLPQPVGFARIESATGQLIMETSNFWLECGGVEIVVCSYFAQWSSTLSGAQVDELVQG